MTVSLVARPHGINPNQLFHWRKPARVGALIAVEAGETAAVAPPPSASGSAAALDHDGHRLARVGDR